MKRRYNQPLASLPHVTTLDQARDMATETECAITDLVGNRAKYEPKVYENYYREYDHLLRELRIREAQLAARA